MRMEEIALSMIQMHRLSTCISEQLTIPGLGWGGSTIISDCFWSHLLFYKCLNIVKIKELCFWLSWDKI